MPRKKTLWAAVTSLCALSLLSLAADKNHDAAMAQKGKITFGRYCASCHGAVGRADGPLARELRIPVPDLTSLSTRNAGVYPYERVERLIRSGNEVRGHGTADMPAWGDAFRNTAGTGEPTIDAAIRNLVHYIWSIQVAGK